MFNKLLFFYYNFMTSRYLTIQKLYDDEFNYLIHFCDKVGKEWCENIMFSYNKLKLEYRIECYNNKYCINTDTCYKYNINRILLKFYESIDIQSFKDYLLTLNIELFITDYTNKIIKKNDNELLNDESILFIKVNEKYKYKDLIGDLLIKKFEYKLLSGPFIHINYDINKIIENDRYDKYNELKFKYDEELKKENEMLKLKNDSDELIKENEKLIKENEKLNIEIEILKNKCKKYLSFNDEIITKLKEDIELLNDENTKLKVDKQILLNEKDELENEKDKLQLAYLELDKDYNESKNEYDKLKNIYYKSIEDYNNLKNEKDTLFTKLKSIKSYCIDI